jgi:hypothetical protein
MSEPVEMLAPRLLHAIHGRSVGKLLVLHGNGALVVSLCHNPSCTTVSSSQMTRIRLGGGESEPNRPVSNPSGVSG